MKPMNDIGLSDVISIMQAKGYEVFKNHIPNIIGIRNANRKSNSYDDRAFVWWTVDGKQEVHTYSITTNPGYYYLENPIKGTQGTAILVPGQYLFGWILGMHLQKQFALIQQGGAVKVYRDNNKDTVLDYDPKKIETGFFGIDLHHGSISDSDIVNKYSAGCQVWRYHEPHEWLMDKFKGLSEMFTFRRFSYTLLDQSDFV